MLPLPSSASPAQGRGAAPKPVSNRKQWSQVAAQHIAPSPEQRAPGARAEPDTGRSLPGSSRAESSLSRSPASPRSPSGSPAQPGQGRRLPDTTHRPVPPLRAGGAARTETGPPGAPPSAASGKGAFGDALGAVEGKVQSSRVSASQGGRLVVGNDLRELRDAVRQYLHSGDAAHPGRGTESAARPSLSSDRWSHSSSFSEGEESLPAELRGF
uniref:Uncharacterized protein n=1 Tax=Cafeteria roenbergensis TaxID=33653 RepID=A0A7S0JPI5_CAFRO